MIELLVAVCRHFSVQVSCTTAPLELGEAQSIAQQGKCLLLEPGAFR